MNGDLYIEIPKPFGPPERHNISFPCNKRTKRLVRELWQSKKL